MKSISLCLMVICTVVLAAQQSQAKKGCQTYGYACYGGHGKRSLSAGSVSANEFDELRPEAPLKFLPNEASALLDGDVMDSYPRYRLIKKMISLLNNHPRRPIASEHLNEMDYSGESSNAN